MASLAPLALPVEDGYRLVSALPARGLEVQAAAWVRTHDDDQHYLCIVTPPDERGWLQPRYRTVAEVYRDLGPFGFRPDDIWLHRPDEPLARGLIDLRRSYVGLDTPTFRATSVGGVRVESPLILYPVSPALTPAA